MRNGLTCAAVCFATTCFLTGCGESSPSPATPSPTTAPESSVAAPSSPDGTLLSNSLGMDLKLIPAGTFTMGDNCGIADVEGAILAMRPEMLKITGFVKGIGLLRGGKLIA